MNLRGAEPGRPRSAAHSYLLAVGLTTATVAVNFALLPITGDIAPYTPFVIAVALSAVYGGLGPGLLATVLGLLAGVYLHVPPYRSLRIETPSEWIAVGFFAAGAVTISVVCGRLHRARRVLEAQRVELEREITSRMAAEREAREYADQLRLADRRKDEFLAQFAHEFRNPLAAILSAVRLFGHTNGNGHPSVDPQQIVDRQARHLARLIEDVLDVARIRRGEVELRREWVDLAHAVLTAVESAMPLIEERHHELDIELPPGNLRVDGDSVRLVQVFMNLLTNAARYTPAGGVIGVMVVRDDRWIEVRVSDSGEGIAPEHQAQVFEPFFRASRRASTAAGGLGIGLSVARRLVEMHEGTLSLQSAGLGHGSVFVVRLPLSAMTMAPLEATSKS